MKLTSKGILLMNKVQTGVPLNFTKVAIGDGYLANGQTLESLTELVHKTMDLDISNIDVNSSGDGTVKIKTTLSNQNLTAGIYVREIGLYANDPDSGEILYCVANAGNTADFIPGKGSDIIENVLEVITITGNASSVTATIDQSLVFTSQKEFNEKVGDVTELSTGKVVEELKVHASHLAEKAAQKDIDNAILVKKEVYVARHKYIRQKFLMKQPSIKAYITGDSIGAGNGSSEYGKTWFYRLSQKVRDVVALGQPMTGFNPLCVAVGSQDIRSVIPNVGMITGKDLTSKSLNTTPFTYDYWFICTGRNDANNNHVDIKLFENLYRLAVRMGIRNGIDVFCMTEQPMIDMVTGEIMETEKDYYNLYADVIRRVAVEEGASLIDVNKHWYDLKEQGIDLKLYTADGTHPNDTGNEKMANLCRDCLLATPTVTNENIYKDGKVVKTLFEPNLAYNVATVTGIGNSRKTYLGLDEAIVLNDGESAQFYVGDIAVDYVFVAGLMKASTGTITVQTPTGYNALTSVAFGDDLGTNAQKTLLYKSNEVNMATRDIKITAIGGTAYITCISVVGNQKISEHTEVNGVFTGTWTRTEVAPSMWTYKTNVADDTIEIDWIGEEINIEFCLHPNGGDSEITTDGLYTSTTNMYATYNGYFFKNPHRNQKLMNTQHKTVIKAKTDSGGRTGVYVKGVRVFSSYNKNGYIIPLKDRIKGFITQPYTAVKNGTVVDNVITSATDVLAEIVSLD
ncbi:GDSL-type esterase/lipase family protein [Clostridium magnum]|nr:GDSL-type esterase/lipase family protein [Clostridium magnum]